MEDVIIVVVGGARPCSVRRRWLLASVAMLVLASVTEGQELKITPLGDQVKTIHSGIIFTCSILDFPGNDVPEIEWLRPDGELISDTVGRVYVEKENERSKKLYIRAISAMDAGRYVCRVAFMERTWEKSTNIILYEEISFRNTPQQVTAKVGDNAFIPCHASGKPEPDISWRFKRQRVPQGSPSPKFGLIVSSRSADHAASSKYNYERDRNRKGLTVFSVEQSDAGFYECRAEVVSQGALRVRTVKLDVLYPPIMEVTPNSTAATTGSDITLHCRAKGNPPVEYIWHKEHEVTYVFQEQVLSGGIKLKVKLGRGPDKTTYVIKNAAERDEGRYFCKARNDIGEVEGHADITLMVPPAIDPLPHKIQVLGDVLILPCRVTGKPEPSISWQKVGSDVVFTSERPSPDPRVRVDTSLRGMARLIISGVRPSDTGLYTCRAVNSANSASRNATLTVEYKPVMVTPGTEVFAWRDETRKFNCTAEGEPVPDVTWFRNNNLLRSNGTYIITGRRGTSILQITVGRRDHWIYGTYSCMAKNPRGMTTQTFHLKEAQSPLQPSNVTVAEESETAVTLTADVGQAAGGLPVTSWRVMYTEAKGSNKPRTFFFGNGEKMRVNGLKAGLVYNFRLSAGNIIGFGRDVRFKVRTPREVPMAPTAAPVPSTTTDLLGGNHTLLRSKQEKGRAGEKREVVSERKPLSPTGSGFLIAIVGAVLAIILISLTATLAFFVCRRKRHRDANVRTVVRKKGKNKDVDDGFELNMRRKESPLPDVVHKDGVTEVVGNGHAAGVGPTAAAAAAGVAGAAGAGSTPLACMSPHMHVKQRVAWNQMIRRAEMESEDEDEVQQQQQVVAPQTLAPVAQQQQQRHPQQQQQQQQQPRGRRPPEDVSPYNELPPPPPFLLDSNAADGNYADIFDGYHSGDNVDDCLDELDGPIDGNYTITLPQHLNGTSYT